MSQSYLRGIYLRLAGVVMLVVVLALGASVVMSHRVFERALAPEMSKKVATIGASVRSLVLNAVGHRIKFGELYGIEQKFDEIKHEVPEIAYFAVTDTHGAVLHQRFDAPVGAAAYFQKPSVLSALSKPDIVPPAVRVSDQYIVSLPIMSAQGPLGMLHIGVDVRFVDSIVLGMTYDMLVVLVVALFFTLELLHFMAGERLESSLKSLGNTIDRGIEGDFSTRTRCSSAGSDFGAVTGMLEAVLARVNVAFEALTREIEAGRRYPAHERPPAIGAANLGLQKLSQRYRFGNEADAARSDNNQISKVRAPLFVFILAEELTRSFLPTYVKSLLVPIPWLSSEIAVGLPISLFMLIVAFAQPHLGAYSERVGQRRAMLIGAGVATLGFMATAFATTVLDLLVWRSLCAVGYAMVFVAGQGYVLEHASASNRARNFAVFVGAIMVATVCGPSIGGILADNIGERMTFGVSALLALGSIVAMRHLPDQRALDPNRPATRAPRLREIGALLVNGRFMAVTSLAAMPAKIVLTGICFYLVPLYILSIGGSQAVTGRLLMSYAVVMVVMAPLSAALASSRERMEWLVGGGLVVSGLGGALLLAGGGTLWVFASIVLIGLGQSLSISAQSALVSEHCASEVAKMGESAVYGVYRLLERIGNALGPVLAGVLVLNFGYRVSFVAIGALAVLSGAAFLLSTSRARSVAMVAARQGNHS